RGKQQTIAATTSRRDWSASAGMMNIAPAGRMMNAIALQKTVLTGCAPANTAQMARTSKIADRTSDAESMTWTSEAREGDRKFIVRGLCPWSRVREGPRPAPSKTHGAERSNLVGRQRLPNAVCRFSTEVLDLQGRRPGMASKNPGNHHSE